MTVRPSLSVVIVTYNREKVLLDTISYLLPQARVCESFQRIIVVDQTSLHDKSTETALHSWHVEGDIHWLKLSEPNLTGAMNRGLTETDSDLVLYVDDDIIPARGLLENHVRAHVENPEVAAVVGQILQPGEKPMAFDYSPSGSHLRRFQDFPFRSTRGLLIENAMAGNLSVKREIAIQVGGFDENFEPPVASRFETEFAKRLVAEGESLWFEPSASIDHLAASSGGTRSQGFFLASASPVYSVGDFYLALLIGKGWDRLAYIAVRPIGQVMTRFHMRRPWWIPVKFIGELRGLCMALRLYARGQRLLRTRKVSDEC